MIQFRNESEKEAWDQFAAAALTAVQSYALTPATTHTRAELAAETADVLLEMRRLRDVVSPPGRGGPL
jgi:hypothetical protein